VSLPEAGFPAVSRDGRLVALTSADPSKVFTLSRDVFVFDLTTTQLTQVTSFQQLGPGQHQDGNPVLSAQKVLADLAGMAARAASDTLGTGGHRCGPKSFSQVRKDPPNSAGEAGKNARRQGSSSRLIARRSCCSISRWRSRATTLTPRSSRT